MAYDQPLDDDRNAFYLAQHPWGNHDSSSSGAFPYPDPDPDAHIGYASADPNASINSVAGAGVDVDVSGVGAGVGADGLVGLENEGYGEGDLSALSGVDVGLDGGAGGTPQVKRAGSKGGPGRKRRKSNASDGGQTGTPGTKGPEKKFKPGTSCAECRRLKIKCDRNIPCGGCQKRGCGDLCPEESIGSIKQLLQDRTALSARVRELEAVLHISGAGSPPHAPAFQYPGKGGQPNLQSEATSQAANPTEAGEGTTDSTDLLAGSHPIDPDLLALSVSSTLATGHLVGDNVGEAGDVSAQFPHPDTLRRTNFPPTDAAKRWSALGGGSGTIADLEEGKANGWQNFAALGDGAGAGLSEGGWDGRPITVEQAQAELPAEGEAEQAVKSVSDKLGWSGLPISSKEANGIVKSIYAAPASSADSTSAADKLHTLALLHAILAVNAAATATQDAQKHALLAQRCLSAGAWLGSAAPVVAQAVGLLVKYLDYVPGEAAQRLRGQLIGAQRDIIVRNGYHLSVHNKAGTDKGTASTSFWGWYISEIAHCVALGVPASIDFTQVDAPHPTQSLADASRVIHRALDDSLRLPVAGWGEIVKVWQEITAHEARLQPNLRCPAAYKMILSSALPSAAVGSAHAQAQQVALVILLSQGIIQLLRPHTLALIESSDTSKPIPADSSLALAVYGTAERALAIVASVHALASGGQGSKSKSAKAQTPAPVPWTAWEAALESAGILALLASQGGTGLAGAAGSFIGTLLTSLSAAYPSTGPSGGAAQKAIAWLTALQATVPADAGAPAGKAPSGGTAEWAARLGALRLGAGGVENEGKKAAVGGMEEVWKKAGGGKEAGRRAVGPGRAWEGEVGQDKDVKALTGLLV